MNSIPNAFYAQSGGMTPVINETARGIIDAVGATKKIGKLLIGRHGIEGLLKEELYDMSLESKKAIQGLYYRPSGAFGSCRYKLKPAEKELTEYQRIIDVCKAHNIRYFFYNGGNDSADTTHKLAHVSRELGYPLICIGVPKTIDNDLAIMDCSPGYGSVAKFVATVTKETGLDIASMSSATQVLILEVMGRDAGWIAAAGGLAREKPGDAPHIVLCPEVPFEMAKFLARVDECVKKYGFCLAITSENLKDKKGHSIADTGIRDAFGHVQVSGLSALLANKIHEKFGYRYRYSVIDCVQRSARHLGCKVDLEQAYALGKAAVKFALEGKNDICPVVLRKKTKSYQWEIGETKLTNIANAERNVPRHYITTDGLNVTKACLDYIRPLIQGEVIPPFKNGLPYYEPLKLAMVRKKLPTFELL